MLPMLLPISSVKNEGNAELWTPLPGLVNDIQWSKWSQWSNTGNIQCIMCVDTLLPLIFPKFPQFFSEWQALTAQEIQKMQDKISDYRKKCRKDTKVADFALCIAVHICAQLCQPRSWIRPRLPKLHAAAAALPGFGTLEPQELQMRPRRQRIAVPGHGQRMAPSPGPVEQSALQKPR